MYLSLFAGIISGILWGASLLSRYKGLANTNDKNNAPHGTFSFLSASSVIKFILIAAILGILFVRYSLNLWVWLASFMVSFWLFVIISTKRYSKM